ncbi:MAG: MFS transporter, partial [Deltaproteobacteria bacterium]|nr:MFS transporter [Deltaproteobacteria bacterium]
GLQSYVLAVTPKGKRSIGHAVKVIGRNSGLIAGTAIGALLYSYIDYSGVFMLASIISLSALFYLGILVPGVEKISGAVTTEAKVIDPQKENAFLTLFKNIIAVIKNSEFMKTLLTIGIVGKMSIAGVVMFAIPLLLTKKGFATEDIGLALMLYYISGMLTTHFATKVVDAPGATRWVLSISAVIGGLSSLFLGFIGISKLIEQASIPGITLLSYLAVGFNTILAQFGIVGIDSYLILFFIVLIGVSNGLLAAPIMTHIGNTEIADKRGVKTVSATYVFMERFGHVTGPAVISLLITVNNGSTLAISFFGVITIALGCLFAIISRTYIPEKPA